MKQNQAKVTRASSLCQPTVEIALVSTKSIQALIEDLACPLCMNKVVCLNWNHIGGGFKMNIECTSCLYETLFCSSPKLGRRYEVATRFCAAWQFAGLTFESLEWVFKTAGGLPPLSRAAYHRLSKQTSHSITKLTDVDLSDERTQMKTAKENQGCKLAFDGTYDHPNNHVTRLTGVAVNVTNGHVVWRKHFLRDLGTSDLTKTIVARDYYGTAHTGEYDLFVDMIETFQGDENPVTHITLDGDQE